MPSNDPQASNGHRQSASPFATSAPNQEPVDASQQHQQQQEQQRRSFSNQGGTNKKRRARPPAGCCGQFYSALVKTVHQKRRDVVGCLLELILPIIFVVGLVLLWLAMGESTKPAAQFLDYANAQHGTSARPNISVREYRDSFCYNDTLGGPIDGLKNCDDVTGSSVTCMGRDTMVPVHNLCYTNLSPLWLAYGVMGSSGSNLVGPFSMDDMITVQWAVRFTIKDTENFNTQLTAMSTSGKLYFAPDNADTAAFVQHLNTTSTLFKYIYGGTYSAGEAGHKAKEVEGTTWAVVDLAEFTASSYRVNLRLNHTAMPQTNELIDIRYLGGTTDYGSLYICNGFATLQNEINSYYLQHVLGMSPDVASPPMTIPMGYAEYNTQAFLAFGGALAPLIVVLAFLYPVSQLAKRLVLEKESRIREAMHIMGLGNAPFYGAWITIYTLQNLLSSIIITIIIKNTFLTRADAVVVFFVFFFFELSTISLAGLISAFMSKSRMAALLTPLIYFALAIPLFAMTDASSGSKSSLLILSPTGFAIGIQLLFDRELGGGLSGSGVTSSDDSPNMLVILFMLAFDTIIYFLLWLYVDAVMPSDWGTTRGCCYCITDPIRACFRFLCGESNAKKRVVRDNREFEVELGEMNATDVAMDDGRNPQGVFEDVPLDAPQPSVRVVGLRKEFERGGKKFVAVNNLYWSMQEGQISVLLGHNGAGKTTTMSMMTGMLEADDGDCFIYGHSVRNELEAVRQEIGYCPQHNILWPELTCEEHLRFFGSIKGLEGDELEEKITEMLEAVDLLDKREYLSSALSGGQKRKLSVAIAFVGGSRLVFLDEPTAGMDVAARRHTWDLLRRMAEGRTILLTTHFMDEADLLGQSIGIMSAGSLQCNGSSLYLKSRLGVGYNIVLTTTPHVDANRIEQTIRRFIPEAEHLSTSTGEISYRLPTSSVSQFQPLMEVLENEGPSSLGVNNFSVAATTLEEVFLQIAHGENNEKKAKEEAEKKKSEKGDAAAAGHAQSAGECIWNVRREEGASAIFFSQLKVSLNKRLKNSMRDRRTQCLQIICPVVCILFAMLLTLIEIFSAPTIGMSLDAYGRDTEVPVGNCFPPMDGWVPFSGRSATLNVTGADAADATAFSTYLMDQAKKHGDSNRYAAFYCNDPTQIADYGSNGLAFYNMSAFHQLPISLQTYYSALAKTVAPSVTMSLSNEPLPKTDREKALANSITAILIGIIIMIPFTFIPSTFVAWIVKERECKARHLQNVSGLGFSVYWLANFLFDMLSFMVTTILVLIVFLIFNREEYVSSETFGVTFLLFLFYGLSGVSFAYLVSFLFNEHATAQNIVMLSNFIAGFLLVLIVFILQIVDSTKPAADALRWIFRLVPSFCLGDGIINLASVEAAKAFGGDDTPWSMDVTGWDIVYMALEFPLAILLTLLIDYPGSPVKNFIKTICFCCNGEDNSAATAAAANNDNNEHNHNNGHNDKQTLRSDGSEQQQHSSGVSGVISSGGSLRGDTDEEDLDVAEERRAVEAGERTDDLVTCSHLRKVYSNGKVAVKDLSFGVHNGEVFGFLGTNGAGKTTTISILCQEFGATSGKATIAGHSLETEAAEALRCIGYCPQFDALLELLTVEEHLYLYAGIRNIVAEDREQVVNALASLCELTEYLPSVTGELSGGNKRKLSVALSLLGGPRVVFLDEPSAGMDPVARRGLWTAIETVADNCAVVLTTHHLEEVEALAQRVAIMVDGTLRCIGTKSHLKHKYGSGFEMSVRVKAEENREAFERYVQEAMPNAQLQEYRGLRFTYALPQDTKLSKAFGLIESQKDAHGITDYSISQTSIEQVFLRISAQSEHQEE